MALHDPSEWKDRREGESPSEYYRSIISGATEHLIGLSGNSHMPIIYSNSIVNAIGRRVEIVSAACPDCAATASLIGVMAHILAVCEMIEEISKKIDMSFDPIIFLKGFSEEMITAYDKDKGNA
jgi:hypothetical protein